ncbi:hypothetical protein BCR44DRAFT_1444859 [Catenaria anguillulae PL171]|uniref:Uncharacterized protein n=1 Tax=Catenaria anguillulae PL171 TaxID=765915 RepID=A0A1Y2HBH5_9FUNG|nr:hypothetical protein BCR44DRAFT_1444859 [Catenaria anguillulae PL171]
MLITMSLWSLKIAFGSFKSPGSEGDVAIVSMSPTSVHSPGQPTAAGENSPGHGTHSAASTHGSVNEPSTNPQMALGRTFKVLTMCILSYWIMFLVIIALFRPFPIHSTAITCTLVALAVATEASFEWLVVQSAKVGNGASAMLSRMGTKSAIMSLTVSKSAAV